MSDPAPGAPLLDVRIETPDGVIAGRIGLPARPLRLAELAAGVLPLVDQLVALAGRRERAAGRAISCQAGCAACCRQLVPVSAPEAWLLDDLWGALPAERRATLAERFEALGRRLDASGLRERMERADATDAEAHAFAARYFELYLACPFLENEACSIYAERPSICREYLVTSPAQHCFDPVDRGVARVAVSGLASQALAQLTAELYGGEPRLIPLPLALSWAEANRELGRRVWDARPVFARLLELLSRP